MKYSKKDAKAHSRETMKGIWAAALMPFTSSLAIDEDGFRRASALFDTLGREELLALPPAEVVHRLYHEETPQLLGEKPLAFACSCSRERVEAMLVSLGSAEADAAVAAGDGEARVTCEFCGQDYRFDAAQMATLFAQAAAAHPSPAALQ